MNIDQVLRQEAHAALEEALKRDVFFAILRVHLNALTSCVAQAVERYASTSIRSYVGYVLATYPNDAHRIMTDYLRRVCAHVTEYTTFCAVLACASGHFTAQLRIKRDP